MHPDKLRAEVGEGAWRALREAGVVVDVPIPDWYPCGDARGCNREVIHDPSERHADKPYVAICGDDLGRPCGELRLSSDDLTLVETSMPALALLLARLYGVRRPRPRVVDDLVGVYQLGHAPDGRSLAFTAQARSLHALWFLRAARTPTTLLAPTRTGVPTELVERYAPDERVALRFLGDELEVADGRVARAAPGAAPRPAGAPTRTVLDNSGERPLDDDAYRALRERADDDPDLALLVDLTAATGADKIPFWTRDADGVLRSDAIPRVQAQTLLELARAGGPVRPGQLQTLIDAGIRNKKRSVEIMRKAIDIKLGRYRWAFINAVAGDLPEARAFVFAPSRGERFAIVAEAK